MIVGNENELEVGEIYFGLLNVITKGGYENFPDQPYKVIRKASWREWIDSLAKEGHQSYSYNSEEAAKHINFYEISLG